MKKTYCFKLYHTKRNRKLHLQIDICCIIYNHCIALHKIYYRLFKKYLNKNKLQKHLTKLKSKYQFWKLVGSQAIQDITDRIDRGYNLFFENIKKKIRTSPPTYKKVKKYKSFTLKQAGWKIVSNNVIIINKQKYKFFKSREIDGIIKTVTIKRDRLGDLYLYFVCEVAQDQTMARTGQSVGYDFGLKCFLTASDGADIECPLFFQQHSKQIKHANRVLSRKKKCSNHRKQARLALARVHKKVANRRKDFHFKTAQEICQNYALICLEDLNMKALQRRFGKKISDLGFANFVQILKYQAVLNGVQVVEIDRFYASSQICSHCGFQNPAVKDLSVRHWICPICGTEHDRDRNAAQNILKVGASTFLGKAV